MHGDIIYQNIVSTDLYSLPDTSTVLSFNLNFLCVRTYVSTYSVSPLSSNISTICKLVEIYSTYLLYICFYLLREHTGTCKDIKWGTCCFEKCNRLHSLSKLRECMPPPLIFENIVFLVPVVQFFSLGLLKRSKRAFAKQIEYCFAQILIPYCTKIQNFHIALIKIPCGHF